MHKRLPAEPPEIPGFAYQRLLGSGGFSDVFLYEQQLPRRLVAVKVLLGGEDLNDTSRQAFIGEANLMAQMSSHPYIVTIFHAAVAPDGRPYFVMEYMPGKSLAERYKTEVIPVEEALRTGVRVASAVATAHQVGILHRDIKPANILANEYGWPALTDFGISSAVDDDLADAAEGEPAATATAGMSVPWSPPEMFADHPMPDERSEVFSLGATIFTAIAGFTPFEVPGGPNGTIDLIGRIERGQITPMQRRDVPASLVAVLHGAMSVRPADRYATAIDFARALQRVEMELGYQPTPIDVPNLNVAAPRPASAPAEGEATSLREVPSIAAQPDYEGARATEQERTSTRSVVRIAAQETTGSRPWGQAASPIGGVQRPSAAGAGQLPPPPAWRADGGATGAAASAAAPSAAAAATAADATSAADAPSDATTGPPPGQPVPTFAEPSLRLSAPDDGPVRPVFERGRIDLPEDTQGGGEIHALRRAAAASVAETPGGRARGDQENPYGDAEKPRNSNLLVGILAGIVVILIAVLAVLGWIFGGKPGAGPGPTGGTLPPPTVVGGAYPPSPVAPIAVRSSDGYITFRWENPDPQNGDTYYWRLSDRSQSGHSTDEPTAVVGPSPEGVKICIDVEIRRNGKTSAEPLVACYPQ